jgi:hypothetical protein
MWRQAETAAGFDDLTAMLQPLLEDRLRLKFHRDARELPVYSLVTPADESTYCHFSCEIPSSQLSDFQAVRVF